MPRSLQFYLLLFCSFFSFLLSAQTDLEPGDFAVLGVMTDLEICGLHAESDEISFVCFKDITDFTNFEITDKGWESVTPGTWGPGEGVLNFFRVGGTVPAGTVITLQGVLNGGIWTYQTISPDNGFVITEVSSPFNLENGGDQFYFRQGADVIYGFNTLGTWAANGTTQQSNLHPSVAPCFNMMASGAEYYKYTNPLSPTYLLDWWHRIQDPAGWNTYPDCITYMADPPVYSSGQSIIIEPIDIGTSCHLCDGCPPYITNVIFDLPGDPTLPPDQFFDIIYTNGIDTFELFHVQNEDFVQITVTDTISYWLISVAEEGGCPLPASLITTQAVFNAPHNNPGTHNSFFICPDYGIINLPSFLGPHDPGGQWFPPLDPIYNLYYVSFWGPGTYYYVFMHDGGGGPGGGCPPDTASIDVHHIDTAGTTIDIGCDVNGTPYDITDDRLVFTLNFMATGGFGPEIVVTPQVYGVPSGSISPSNMGTVGVPTVFMLDPGTATLGNQSIRIAGMTDLFFCDWIFPLPAPGFCSDPCDPDMAATLSGNGADICPNSCPDEPITMHVEVDGGKEDYTMDFSVSAPGYPTWTFTGIEFGFEIHDIFIEVCIADVPAPVFDEGSGFLVIPRYLAGADVTITLVNVYDYYDCTALLANDQHVITIHSLPQIATTSLAYCKAQATNVDLTEFDLLISNFLDVTWYDENPFDGGSPVNFPTAANLENIGQLWAYVEDDYCGNSIQVPFTILPEPNLNAVPPLQVCEGGSVNLLSIILTDEGNSMATYTFHLGLPPDTTNQIDTLIFFPADTTTIYVLATSGMCYDTLPIEIDVQDYPDFSLEALPCDLILDTYSILFTSSADSIHSSVGIVINNPNGQDTIGGIPNDTSVIIEILNPSGLCNDTVSIVAPNCNCPLINQPVPSQPAYSICEGDPIPVLSVNVGGGFFANWYDVPSGGVPLLQNSLTYQPPSATSAIYYAEAFDPSNNCYSIRTVIPFDVFPIADLQMLADPQLCEAETIDFNTFIPIVLNGVPGSGQWFNLSNNQPVTGIIQPQNGDAWYYLFTSNPGACTSLDTLGAVVNPLPSVDLYNILCDSTNLTYDYAFTSDADILVTSIGTLIQIPGTDSFFLENIPFDIDVQFGLEITGSGCTFAFTQPAPDCSCPALLDIDNHQACSDQGNIDLSAFEGPGVNGSWQMVSTPPGSNPATLAGSNFQGIGADDGLYTLRFIRNVILADCIDSALFMFQLSESPFADAGSDAIVCAPDQIVLSGIAGGSNVQFNWQENGSGSITNPNSLNTTYTPTLADITSGSVSFSLTAIDQTGFCPSASETISIDIDGSAYFILDPTTITYCDTADINVDLDALVSFGTTGGEWFFPDTVSAPIVGSSQFNPTTLQAGNYTVFYTTSNAVLPCKNDTVPVSLIIENCACPSVALSSPTNALCSESSTQDLNDFLITTEPGTWSIVGVPGGSKPAVITGSDFKTNNSDDGIYRLRFTLTNPVAGCPDFSEINLEVIATPTAQIESIECADDLQGWEVIIVTTAEVTYTGSGILTYLGNDRYLIERSTFFIDLIFSVSNGLCTRSYAATSPDCACTLDISNLPGSVSLCPEEKIVLDAQVNGGKGNVTSFWIVTGDSLYQNSLEVDQAGTYHFVSVDSLGCKEEHLTDVIIYQEMVPDVSMVDITCPGDKDGSILLHAILGGNGPFFISLNGGNSQPISSFPYSINGLGAGNYQIELLDAFNCSITFTILIQSASSESIDLGPDQTILVGDSVLISPVLSFTPDSFYWLGDISSIDPAQLDNWIKPDVDQFFELFGIDDKGCLNSDDLIIKVLLTSHIYIPTIFSPNNDGINDLLAPLADPSVTSIEYFEIYSRWGELVYSARNFVPGSNTGWDGTMNTQRMMPGVFVYRLSATNKKGRVIVQYGDVTLIR